MKLSNSFKDTENNKMGMALIVLV